MSKKVSYDLLAVEDNKLFLSLSKTKDGPEFYDEYTKSLDLLCKALGWTIEEYLKEEILRIDQSWLAQQPIKRNWN